MIVGPAGSGKTEYVLRRAVKKSTSLGKQVRIVIPSQLQKISAKERLARLGGSLGVRLSTFNELAEEILEQNNIPIIFIPERIQNRILQREISKLELSFYQEIKELPGFIQVAADVIRELKAGGISADSFLSAVKMIENPERLSELGEIFEKYQSRLSGLGWEDSAGSILLAASVLGEQPSAKLDWEFLVIDGFDNFTPPQIKLISVLAEKIPGFVVTLTGLIQSGAQMAFYRRFDRTRKALLSAADFTIVPLEKSQISSKSNQLSAKIRSTLFNLDSKQVQLPEDSLVMTAAANRSGEVRRALRWIKRGVVEGQFDLGRTAVVARNIQPYRELILSTAEEFGIPLRFVGGQPLAGNPAVAVLEQGLELVGDQDNDFHWRGTIAILKTPYFDWTSAVSVEHQNQTICLESKYIPQFATAARWGSVIAGNSQWEEVFNKLSKIEKDAALNQLGSNGLSDNLPVAEDAQLLRKLFIGMRDLLIPPRERMETAEHCQRVLDTFIGREDQELGQSLNMLSVLKSAPEETKERDLAAVEELIKQLRAMAAADEAVQRDPISFDTFKNELKQTILNANYSPQRNQGESVLVLDAAESRGLHFEGLAVLGLAEGEFPAVVSEDPFLRDADRELLNTRANLPLLPSTESGDAEYFHELLMSGSQGLLLTRPRLTENGTTWQPSPFWEEILRIADTVPEVENSRNYFDLGSVASWNEFLEMRSELPSGNFDFDNLISQKEKEWSRINHGMDLIRSRINSSEENPSQYDGWLTASAEYLGKRYGAGSSWSASRLESYRTCPFLFFIGQELRLEKVEPPREGLDARQLGNLYHKIFEEVYTVSAPDTTLENCIKNLEEVAEKVFRTAPEKEGFRELPSWEQTKEEIINNVRNGLIILENINPDFQFYQAEKRFGISGDSTPALIIRGDGNDYFKLRGLIDRIDVNSSQEIRIVDYKTSSSAGFSRRALSNGEKIQLPLYALAARENLELGEVAEGFYFHVQSGETSGLKLSDFKYKEFSGPEGAIDLAVKYAWDSVSGARAGYFLPEVPLGGCPDYCPAAAFCWHFAPRQW